MTEHVGENGLYEKRGQRRFYQVRGHLLGMGGVDRRGAYDGSSLLCMAMLYIGSDVWHLVTLENPDLCIRYGNI